MSGQDDTWAAHDGWPADGAGVLALPSGRLVRGRGLRHAAPEGLQPMFAVCCTGRRPAPQPWAVRWIRWPDFRLPQDRADAGDAFAEAWRRSASERVEVCCGGGRGRTGTALACIVALDAAALGTPIDGDAAVAHVRAHYDRRAVETPWQARFVRRFAASGAVPGG